MWGRVLSILVVFTGAALADNAIGEGRKLYRGLGPNPLKARIGRVENGSLTCAGCHGRNGGGGREGRVAIPAIGRPALQSGGAYDEASFRRTLTDGVTPDGRRLAGSMPRYTISPDEARTLWDYLDVLGAEDRAGISSGEIVVAIPALPGDLGEAEAFRAMLERRWRDVGPSLVHGRALRFATLSLVRGQTPSMQRLPEIFLAIVWKDDRTKSELELLSLAGIPSIVPRADVPSGSDIIRIGPGERDIQDRLAELVSSGGAELREAGTSLAPASTATIVVTGDASTLRALIGSGLPLKGRQVVLTSSLARQAPDGVADLMELGVEVTVLRGIADQVDPSRFATLIVTLLDKAFAGSGRNLTRSSFLANLQRIQITLDGWSLLDFSRNPASRTIETIRLKRPG